MRTRRTNLPRWNEEAAWPKRSWLASRRIRGSGFCPVLDSQSRYAAELRGDEMNVSTAGLTANRTNHE
jgi:hypothetical protein